MTDDSTTPGDRDVSRDPGSADNAPTVSCSRCDRSWDLQYELEDLQVGNMALEQFALDHHRHTGHFPDDLTPWLADCRRCPQEESFLSERPARRWAETHARHTRHGVDLFEPSRSDAELVEASRRDEETD